MVRHGYPNCIACHVSPTGGGVLTPYGRQLSGELLSAPVSWLATRDETAFAYGLVTPPEWLQLGGEYRSVYDYQNTPTFRSGGLIFMQGDLEAAAIVDRWTVAASLGYREAESDGASLMDHLISRRHYLLYHLTDELAVRAGRYSFAYGINTADHIISTKQGLGWSPGQEPYNVEASWIGESLNLYLTAVLGRPDDPDLGREHGAAASAGLAFADRYKAGLSLFAGSNRSRSRQVAGPWGILGFTPHLFLLSEFDVQRSTPEGGGTRMGAVDYQRLDYEFSRGFHVFLTQEFGRLDLSDLNSLSSAYAIGLQAFPRPHWELTLTWQRARQLPATQFDDEAWLLMHFYF
jgi:hypothetical protein